MRISWAERLDLARGLASGAIDIDTLNASEDLDQDDKTYVARLGLSLIRERYEDERRKALGGPQKRALRLLRGLLSDEQVAQLRRSRSFRITLPSGRTYGFSPNSGAVRLLERHGSRWFMVGLYCLHEEPLDMFAAEGMPGMVTVDAIPLADRTIAHLLLLLADEGRFLAEANYTPFRRHMGWDPEWMRRHWDVRNGCRLCGERTHTRETCVSRRELGTILAQEMRAAS